MLVNNLKSLLSPLRTLGSRFSNESDSDFQKQTKKSVTSDNIKDIIDKMVKSEDVVLFMKGTVTQPQCGYSKSVVKILQQNGIKNIKGVNILQDTIMREQVKLYSNWPTYPQLYIKGKLVGGCDIVNQMDSDGSLKEMLQANKVI